jgi:hypothetical protein
MALTQSLLQLRTSVRKFANVQGTTALLRHPDADLNDYINRSLGSLHRQLTVALPDQRYLASTTVTTAADVATYSLPSNFDHLISIDLNADSHRTWLQAYEMNERPTLTSADEPFNGRPLFYRLRGGNIEYLPTPGGVYSSLIWYVPNATQLTGDSQVFDTISRLDDYLIAHASRPIAIKDKNWDLVNACKSIMDELSGDMDIIARGRDKNSPPRVIDVYTPNRWGFGSRGRRFP